jgi:hypothetical protein
LPTLIYCPGKTEKNYCTKMCAFFNSSFQLIQKECNDRCKTQKKESLIYFISMSYFDSKKSIAIPKIKLKSAHFYDLIYCPRDFNLLPSLEK